MYFISAGALALRLVELMDESYQIFGIEVPWTLAWRDAVANNQTSAFPSMEQLADSRMWRLAGHSFAGLIAFEVAHQFQRQGGHVDMVMLFDTFAKYLTVREVACRQWRQDWKQGPNGLSTDQLSQSIGFRLRRSWLVARRMLRQEARKVFSALFPKRSETGFDEQGVPLPWWLHERYEYPGYFESSVDQAA